MRSILWSVIALAAANAGIRPATAEELPFQPGHLQLVSGLVAYRLPGEAEWLPADRNYPVFTGMRISTDPQSRAEIGLRDNALRMSSDTVIEVSSLDERLTDIVVHQGKIQLSLRQLRPSESVQLELSSGTLWLLRSGHYLIDASSGNGGDRIRVLDGKARFVSDNVAKDMHAGDEAIVADADHITITRENGSAAPPSQAAPATALPIPGQTMTAPATPSQTVTTPATDAAQVPAGDAPPPDGFMQWAVSRDRGDPASPAAAPAASDVASLDAYGHWRNTGDYGQVWFPADVPADWAPYRYGHWASIPPWGWTWIDDQPWGFMPSHYGRWVNVDGQWGWVAGNAAEAAVYAPALVTFVGTAEGIEVPGAAQPAVAWVPLGPGEAYWPWYQADAAYIARVNVADVREFRHAPPERVEEFRRGALRTEFANRRFATMVDRQTFAAARPVGAAMIRTSSEHFAHLAPVAGAMRVAAVRPAALAHEGPGVAAEARARAIGAANPHAMSAGVAGRPGPGPMGGAMPHAGPAGPQSSHLAQAAAPSYRSMGSQMRQGGAPPQHAFEAPRPTRTAMPQMGHAAMAPQMGRPTMAPQMGRPAMPQMSRVAAPHPAPAAAPQRHK